MNDATVRSIIDRFSNRYLNLSIASVRKFDRVRALHSVEKFSSTVSTLAHFTKLCVLKDRIDALTQMTLNAPAGADHNIPLTVRPAQIRSVVVFLTTGRLALVR